MNTDLQNNEYNQSAKCNDLWSRALQRLQDESGLTPRVSKDDGDTFYVDLYTHTDFLVGIVILTLRDGRYIMDGAPASFTWMEYMREWNNQPQQPSIAANVGEVAHESNRNKPA